MSHKRVAPHLFGRPFNLEFFQVLRIQPSYARSYAKRRASEASGNREGRLPHIVNMRRTAGSSALAQGDAQAWAKYLMQRHSCTMTTSPLRRNNRACAIRLGQSFAVHIRTVHNCKPLTGRGTPWPSTPITTIGEY